MVRYDKSSAERGAQYVEDRRGRGLRRRSGSGNGRRGGVAVGGGIGGIIIMLLALFFGVDLGGGGGFGLDTQTPFDGGAVQAGDAAAPIGVDPDAETVEFMQFLMFDIQDTWDAYFDQAGQTYQTTSLVIFEDAVDTGCGRATSQVGPFYCPAPNDRKVYIDLGFWDLLASPRFGAGGDFAQAYVVAHEVGHHIQSITGISDAVRRAQAEDPGNRNEYSVRQELQADCLAGVWAFSANRRLTRDSGLPIIEPGDIDEGLAAAAAVGDDRIQSQMGGGVNPDTWTHGSSEQRKRWFLTGFDNGDPELCDTFAVDQP